MNKIRINCQSGYDILIGNNIIADTGKYIRNYFELCAAVVVSDDIVFSLYGKEVCASLKRNGFDVSVFIFPHGEKSKNLDTYGKLAEHLCSEHISRSDIIVALGGGVTGDLAGFAAATFHRGMKYIQIPTTLLAAVDSSVGGKTGVDLNGGKNQVGCFFQPSFVLCDINLFDTLPEEEYRCGCAEIIKYAMIQDQDFFAQLKNIPVKEQYEHVVSECVRMKKYYVESDEFDWGCRMMLNFGHTIGHAVEKCSKYKIRHGQAVSAGMVAITNSAVNHDLCDRKTYVELKNILNMYGLPVNVRYSSEKITDAVLSDKKIIGDKTNIIVPRAIGKCEVLSVDRIALEEWIRSSLNS